MGKSGFKEEVTTYIDSIKEELIRLSREIHANPEILFKELNSVEILGSFLEKGGFNVDKGICDLETAFKATYKESRAGPAIAFLAEYDAVPGIGHGCGHNLSGMASVGAGIAVSKVLDRLKGSVVVMGTPAEEGGGGKVIMLEKGAFDGIDVAMMVHACYYTKISHDFIALAGYRFHFKGRTAHASVAPHDGINALDAAVLTHNAIGLLRQQIKGDHRIHLQISQDETALNMIPDSASCNVVLRAPTGEKLEKMTERVKRCADGAAIATGCELDLEQTIPLYQHMKHNEALEELFLKNLEAEGVKEDYPDTLLSASTDAGNVSQVIPTLHPMVAICGPEAVPHTKEFAEASKSPRGEEMFITCAHAMAMTAVDILEFPQNMERTKEGV